MGNNIGGGASSKAAKIMKINGEYFKLKTPAKVIDIIKDYPDHILLDSDDFMRYNLRADPLGMEYEIKPKKIYLLFELPKFPDSNKSSPLKRVRSGVGETAVRRELTLRMTKRSISDLSVRAKSTDARSTVSDHDGSGGSLTSSPGVGSSTRVKMRLPRAQVETIMKESHDDVEVARRILRVFAAKKGGDTVVDTVEEGGCREEDTDHVVVVEDEMDGRAGKHWFNVHGTCSPLASSQRKYKKLSS